MKPAGILSLYSLENTADPGMRPDEKLICVGQAYYTERTVGVTRAYAAMSANQRIDKLVRCYKINIPVSAEYVILEDGLQYRIALKQQRNMDVDLTLERLENLLNMGE